MIRNVRRLMFSIFLASVISCTPVSLFGIENMDIKYYMSPEAIIHEISSRGAGMVAHELYSHPNEWNAVLRNIAGGSESWLRVAVALHRGADAGSSEMLTFSVGEALENAPANVLRIVVSEFQLATICGGPDVDDNRYNSYDLAIRAVNLRQERISAVSDIKLNELSKKCAQLLEESKADIKRFFGVVNDNRGKN